MFEYAVVMDSLTPASMRAARGILKWSLRDLADKAGVALTTVHQAEAGTRAPHAATATKLIAAFANAGVEVLAPPADGARRTPPEA